MTAGVDIYRATLYCTASQGGAVPVNNVLWFREIADQGGIGDELLAADLILDARWIWLRNQQSTLFTYDKVTVQRMWPAVEPPFTLFFAANKHGSLGAGHLPAINSMILRIYGLATGRSHQGRLYLSGFVQSTATGNSWNAGGIADIQTWSSGFSLHYSGLVGGGGQFAWGVWSPKLGGGRPPTSGAGFSPIDHLFIDPVVRLQRSREFGVSRRHAGHH